MNKYGTSVRKDGQKSIRIIFIQIQVYIYYIKIIFFPHPLSGEIFFFPNFVGSDGLFLPFFHVFPHFPPFFSIFPLFSLFLPLFSPFFPFFFFPFLHFFSPNMFFHSFSPPPGGGNNVIYIPLGVGLLYIFHILLPRRRGGRITDQKQGKK